MDASQPVSTALKATPLADRHRALGAKMVPFAGYSMPVQYTGLIQEHLAVRTVAGIFDVSHMGEFDVRGPAAAGFLDSVIPTRVSMLENGRVVYSVLTTEQGTIVDDLLVYRLSSDHYMVVVNASNRAQDLAWFRERARGWDATVEDRSDDTALIAFQGPAARELMVPLTKGFDPLAVKYYHVVDGEIAGRRVRASRTGYTGEMGYEIFVAPSDAGVVWDALMAAGRDKGVLPAGLGARDTLRLEAGLPLYGNDIDMTTTVLEAALEFTIDWTKPDFVGRAALAREKAAGVRRRRVGFQIEGKGIPRHGNTAYVAGQEAGPVTSGTWSPSLEVGLGMAYLPVAHSAPGQRLEIDIRGRRHPAVVVEMPFYRRRKLPPA